MQKTLIIFVCVLFVLAIIIIIWAAYFRDKTPKIEEPSVLTAEGTK